MTASVSLNTSFLTTSDLIAPPQGLDGNASLLDTMCQHMVSTKDIDTMQSKNVSPAGVIAFPSPQCACMCLGTHGEFSRAIGPCATCFGEVSNHFGRYFHVQRVEGKEGISAICEMNMPVEI